MGLGDMLDAEWDLIGTSALVSFAEWQVSGRTAQNRTSTVGALVYTERAWK